MTYLFWLREPVRFGSTYVSMEREQGLGLAFVVLEAQSAVGLSLACEELAERVSADVTFLQEHLQVRFDLVGVVRRLPVALAVLAVVSALAYEALAVVSALAYEALGEVSARALVGQAVPFVVAELAAGSSSAYAVLEALSEGVSVV